MPYSNSLNERALLLADRLGILWSDPNPWKVPLEGVEECCRRRGLFVPHAHMNCCSLGQRFRACCHGPEAVGRKSNTGLVETVSVSDASSAAASEILIP